MSDEKSELAKRVEDAAKSPVMKALVIGDSDRWRVQPSNAIDEDTRKRLFEIGGLMQPPYDVDSLLEIFELSNSLRQNVDAYTTNIDAHGHHFVPVLDLESDDANDLIAESIYLERLAARDRGEEVPAVSPSPEEIAERRARVATEARVERFRIAQFFKRASVEESFVALRKKLRQDREVTGNAYLEVLRDQRGNPAQFVYMQPQTMRLTTQEARPIQVTLPVRTSPISLGREKVWRRFRKFVQVVNNHIVFFKEFGDPRIVSSSTGKTYPTIDAFRSAETKSGECPPPATEILHFKVHSPKGPYGVPRWIGSLLSVLGSREAEEVNFLYFQNKSVPPLAMIVSGGRVSTQTADRIRDFIDTEIKGKRNFHKILVIEGEPSSSADGLDATGRMKIELKPLTSAQQGDALFSKYDERNLDKVGQAFRLPRLLRGDVRDFNRATADAALEFAETQVFGPEREDFDFEMNRILEAMGFRYWEFRSNSVQIRDPKSVAEILKLLSEAGIIVPSDGRAIASDLVFNRRLPRIEEEWTNLPIILAQQKAASDAKLAEAELAAELAPEPAEPEPADDDPAAEKPKKPKPKSTEKATERVNAMIRRMKRGSERDLVSAARTLLLLRAELEKAEEEGARAELLASRRDEERAAGEDPTPVEKSVPGDDVEVIRMPAAAMRELFALEPVQGTK